MNFYNLTILLSLTLFPREINVEKGLLEKMAPVNELTAYIFLSESCPICISLTPEIRRISAEYKSKGVTINLVFPNTTDSNQQGINKFMKKYKLTSSAMLDTGQIITNKYGASITPEVFLIENKSGKIIYSGKVNDEYVALGKRKQTNINHLLDDAISNYLSGDRNKVTSTKAVGCFIIREKH